MRVGVTGNYASGKGTVCKFFEELGAVVIDTDFLAREIVEPGSRGLIQMVEAFGKEILDENGTLDRRRFANIVFKNDDLVKKLNEITHPLILELVKERSKGDKIYVINTPLLFESGFDKEMDFNIVVKAEISQVIERGMKRDSISESEIKDRLNFQFSLNKKIELADKVIDNSSSMGKTKRQVSDLWKILTEIMNK